MQIGIVDSFGFILPVNALQNMIINRKETFEARDFVCTGLAITEAELAYCAKSCSLSSF